MANWYILLWSLVLLLQYDQVVWQNNANWNIKKYIFMPKEVLSEKLKSLIMTLLVEGCSEQLVASIFKISQTPVYKNKVKQQTLAATKIQTGRVKKKLSPLIISFRCHLL